MRSDFAALILTHGRPDRVVTVNSLRRHGYTGRIVLVVDDEDKTVDQYRDRYGESVVMFSKEEIARTFDEGDNFDDRRTITYARNAAFDVAESVGARYFVQLDDDYVNFYWRFDEEARYGGWQIRNLDALFEGLVEFLEATPFLSVAISQGGDHIGGAEAAKAIRAKRKAMNTFVCSTAKRFRFVGRMNEDVNTYTSLQRSGGAFLTFTPAQVNQMLSQSNAGGITELYRKFGTYVKSFYTVMFSPSCAVVSSLKGNVRAADGRDPGSRIHHKINWNATAPKIVPERFRKPRS